MTDTKEIYCFAGKVAVSIGDRFKWTGSFPGTYTVKRWGTGSMYSPAGIGGTCIVWVENEHGEEMEWCGDSVAHGVFLTKNPNYWEVKHNRDER